jgi:uncharacterized membrane protein YtjA (UPF0391 family)
VIVRAFSLGDCFRFHRCVRHTFVFLLIAWLAFRLLAGLPRCLQEPVRMFNSESGVWPIGCSAQNMLKTLENKAQRRCWGSERAMICSHKKDQKNDAKKFSAGSSCGFSVKGCQELFDGNPHEQFWSYGSDRTQKASHRARYFFELRTVPRGVDPERWSRTTYGIEPVSGPVYGMLKWALIFLVIAIIAGLLGFMGIAGAAAGIAKVLFGLFVAVFLILLLLGLFAGRKVP